MCDLSHWHSNAHSSLPKLTKQERGFQEARKNAKEYERSEEDGGGGDDLAEIF